MFEPKPSGIFKRKIINLVTLQKSNYLTAIKSKIPVIVKHTLTQKHVIYNSYSQTYTTIKLQTIKATVSKLTLNN